VAHVGGDGPGLPTGRAHEQRHVRELVVDGVAVLEAAVVPELLAVVARDHDDRVVVETERGEAVEQAPERRIGVGHLPVVQRLGPAQGGRVRPETPRAQGHHLLAGPEHPGGIVAVLGQGEVATEGLGRVVDGVRVEVVDEQEERLRVAGLPEPLEGRIGGRLGPADLRVRVEVHRVEAAELARDAELLAEERHVDDRMGPIARGAEDPGKGLDPVREAAHAVAQVASSPVLRGMAAAQDRCARGQGPRCVGVAGLEARRPLGEPLEVGRHAALATRLPHAVGAQGVHDDEQHVRAPRLGAGREAQDQRGEGGPAEGRGAVHRAGRRSGSPRA